MGRGPSAAPSLLSGVVSLTIETLMFRQSMNPHSLSRASGVKYKRLNALLDAEASWTIPELEAVSRTFELTVAQVIDLADPDARIQKGESKGAARPWSNREIDALLSRIQSNRSPDDDERHDYAAWSDRLVALRQSTAVDTETDVDQIA